MDVFGFVAVIFRLFKLGSTDSLHQQNKIRQRRYLGLYLQYVIQEIATKFSIVFGFSVSEIRQEIDLFKNVFEIDLKNRFDHLEKADKLKILSMVPLELPRQYSMNIFNVTIGMVNLYKYSKSM